jgi:hypothetical protein
LFYILGYKDNNIGIELKRKLEFIKLKSAAKAALKNLNLKLTNQLTNAN